VKALICGPGSLEGAGWEKAAAPPPTEKDLEKGKSHRFQKCQETKRGGKKKKKRGKKEAISSAAQKRE